MQVSSLLALHRSARDVATHIRLTSVSALKYSTATRSWGHRELVKHVCGVSRTSTRSITITASTNHLQDVTEYTAANPVSVWKSNSLNPYENLAIENYLLRKSNPASRILFTYVNWPCVVIGRNQNPWLECNLARMQRGLPYHSLGNSKEQAHDDYTSSHGVPEEGEMIPLDLVRRRSGGGTVIHDAGNLNFSFIVPNDKDFTRDTHAQLVVSMLMEPGLRNSMEAYYSSVRVNERHDIVMKRKNMDEPDTTKEFKISGSAFKLTRGRALHHGTILHSSPNIAKSNITGPKERSFFSEILSSPAKPYLDAKGVGSVRSPVHNLFRAENQSDRTRYSSELQQRLQTMFRAGHRVSSNHVNEVSSLDCTAILNKQIFDDIQEMLTDEWRFCQTPSFEFSSTTINDTKIHFQVKHGIIGTPSMEDASGSSGNSQEALATLVGKKLHEISNWAQYFSPSPRNSTSMISHLGTVFPRVIRAKEDSDRAIEDVEQVVEAQKAGKQDVIVVKRRSAQGSVETEREGENLIVER